MSEGQTPQHISAVVLAALREPSLLLGVGAVVGLFLSSSFIPLPGVILSSFTPVPLIYHYCRRGRIFGLTMAGLSALIVFLVYLSVDRPVGVLFFLAYATLALFLAEGLIWRMAPARVIGYSVGAVLVLAAVLFTIGGLSQGQTPWTFTRLTLEKQVRASLIIANAILTGKDELIIMEDDPRLRPRSPNESISAPENQWSGRSDRVDGQDRGVNRNRDTAGRTPGNNVITGDEFKALVKVMITIFPGLMVMGIILLAWANYMLSYILLHRAGWSLAGRVNLKLWRTPESLVWVVISCGIGLFLPVDWLKILCINAMLVPGMIYFF